MPMNKGIAFYVQSSFLLQVAFTKKLNNLLEKLSEKIKITLHKTYLLVVNRKKE